MNVSGAMLEAVRQMNDWGKASKPFFFLIDFRMQHPLVLPPEALAARGFRFSMPDWSSDPGLNPFRIKNEPGTSSLTTPAPALGKLSLHPAQYPFESYRMQFDRVMTHLRAGDSYLVNLTCETPVQLLVPLQDLYDRVQAKYKLLIPGQFLVFSPETFVRIHNGILSSCPMKGTIDAHLPDAAQTLLENPKEKAEHCTIVDLIRNDLSTVASGVRVNRFRYVDRVNTGHGALLQVSSEISGLLPADYASRIGDILLSLLPAGSVTGAPKKKTVEIILEAETYERGFYTGIFGIFDGQNLDSAVAIRFLEQKEDGFVYKSGGGITALSRVEDEYDEMIKKIYVPVY